MKTIDQVRALCEGCSGPEMCPAELTAGDVLGLLDELESFKQGMEPAEPVALPVLPECQDWHALRSTRGNYYTADQMREYAHAAIAAKGQA